MCRVKNIILIFIVQTETIHMSEPCINSCTNDPNLEIFARFAQLSESLDSPPYLKFARKFVPLLVKGAYCTAAQHLAWIHTDSY